MTAQLFKFGVSKPKTTASEIQTPSTVFNENLEMSDDFFRELRDEIYKHCGIYYTESKKYLLEGRISKRLVVNKMDRYEQYLRLLRSSGNREELDRLFEAITINETYFYRAPQQFEAFEKIIVPEILEKKKTQFNPTFRIWSAASSSGEESYTLAIMILENLKYKYPKVQFQIVGSDINNAVLDTARKAAYKEYAIRNIPPNILQKYFKQNANIYQLNDEVKKMVKFVNINLYDANQVRLMSQCDVIFCANVLIYFDMPSKQLVVSHLYNALNKGGYLLIGYSESLHGVSKAFKLVHLPKAMAYQKE
jgi:chemotaxis protein methyltransferase CheR